ncbi:uncharacterized protein LOC21397946 isoform X1 [Morus notabilis]|uniref:uncharacterized protein LOC21397946 isoform X1 n=2 Tax=Morus notabilis TaxID=981085 RepID=UPI000CED1944|nr:uncharacterized protein LOC21397946 isoform X1 [Morus notabilis]
MKRSIPSQAMCPLSPLSISDSSPPPPLIIGNCSWSPPRHLRSSGRIAPSRSPMRSSAPYVSSSPPSQDAHQETPKHRSETKKEHQRFSYATKKEESCTHPYVLRYVFQSLLSILLFQHQQQGVEHSIHPYSFIYIEGNPFHSSVNHHHSCTSPPDDLQGSTSSAPPKKRTRGPDRSKGTSHLISENKLDMTYNKGELHPYGDNASRFASEIGIIVRDHAPLRVKGWSKIDNGDKEVIYTRIKDKFNLNLNDTDLVNIIDSHCSNRYKNHRNSLHGYYKNMIKNGKNPRAHPPSKVRSNEDWEWLCDNIFSNPQWQKRSEAATGNRGRLTHVHRAGSKSFIGHRSQVSSEGVFELGRIELFKETHWNAAHS